MLKLGVSYFGNRFYGHAQKDLDEIARHCNFVVHTFSETDFHYHQSCLKDIFAYSKKLGLEVWVDPWGVGGVFGGESFSKILLDNRDCWQRLSNGQYVPALCINNREFRRFLKSWIETAGKLGAEVIFWDEPHLFMSPLLEMREIYSCTCMACREIFDQLYHQAMPEEINDQLRLFHRKIIKEFLVDLFRLTKKKNLKNALCLYALAGYPEYDLFWEEIASAPELDIFGCDPYWRLNKKEDPAKYVGFFSKKVYDTCQRNNKEGQIWLQAMSLPEGKEKEIVTAAQSAFQAGIRNFAGWSYDGGAILDNTQSSAPEEVKKVLFQAYDSLKKKR
ncbi:MAG: hypothetical protein ABII74_03090 [Elusimicrobiota bacterium]